MKIPQTLEKRTGQVATVIAFPLAVVAAALLSPLLIVIALDRLKVWLVGPDSYWRPWFAWHPVRLDRGGELHWLQWVERRKWYDHTFYRLPGDMAVFAAEDGYHHG